MKALNKTIQISIYKYRSMELPMRREHFKLANTSGTYLPVTNGHICMLERGIVEYLNFLFGVHQRLFQRWQVLTPLHMSSNAIG